MCIFFKVLFFAFRICTWKQTCGGSPSASTSQTSWLWASALHWGSLPRRVTTATSSSGGWRRGESRSTCNGQGECVQLNTQLSALQTHQERHTHCVHVQSVVARVNTLAVVSVFRGYSVDDYFLYALPLNAKAKEKPKMPFYDRFKGT